MMEALNQFISSNFAYAMGWTIVHSIWQGLLVAFLIKYSFKSFNFSSSTHKHNIAFGSLMLIFGLSITNFFHYWIEASQTTTIVLTEIVPSFSVQGSRNTLIDPASSADWFSTYGPYLTAIWMLGFLWMGIKSILNLLSLNAYRKNSLPIENRTWTKELNKLLDKIDLSQNVQIRHTATAIGVCTFGFLKPIILIPTAIITSIPPEEIKHILAHELTHIKRNDFLLNLVQLAIETIMYYNPGVYILSKIIRRERELACDQASLVLTKNNIAYAKTLLKLSQITNQEKTLTLAFANDQNDFEERIKAILSWKEKIYSSKNKWLMKALTLSLMTIVLFAFQSPNIELNAAVSPEISDNTPSIESYLAEEDGDIKIKIDNYVSTLEKVEPKVFTNESRNNTHIIELDTASKNNHKLNIIIDSESDIAFDIDDNLPQFSNSSDTFPELIEEREWEEIAEFTKQVLEEAFEGLENSNIFVLENDSLIPKNLFENEKAEEALSSLFERLSEMEFEKDHFLRLKEFEEEELHDLQSKIEASMNIFTDSLGKINKFFHEGEVDAIFPEILAGLEHEYFDNFQDNEFFQKDKNDWIDIENTFFHKRGIDEVFESKLADSGLINKGESFKIELSQDKLKVNGKKQPDSLRNEFLQLYKKTKGKALSKNGKFKYEIEID